jgi:PAS domain S-box-containing protein
MSYLIRNLRVLAACVAVVALLAIALALHRLPVGSLEANHLLIERVICAGAAGLITYLALWPTRSRMSQEAQLLRAVADGVTEVVFVKDVRGKYLYMNRAGFEILGKAPAQIIGHSNEDLFPPDVARSLDAACQPVIATVQPSRVEHDVPTANCTRTFFSTKVPYRNREGELIGVMGIAHDITDRKQMEAQLRRSHEQLKDVLGSITDGMYTCDGEWRFTYINRRAKELLRLSDADLGRILWQVRPEAAGSIFEQQFSLVMKERTTAVFEAEYDARHWEVHAYPTTDGIAVYFQDISERKEVEQELRKQERQLGEAQRIAHVGSWRWNLQSDQIEWSDEHCRICGLPPQKSAISSETAFACLHPEDREMVLRHCREAIDTTGEYQCELRIVWPDGTRRFAHSRGEVVRDASDRPIEMFGTLQDITERKVAQDRLAESELRFRQLAENIREVFWMSDPHKSEILYVSPGYAETWGRSPEDLGTDPMAFIESIHPDDRPKVLEWVKNQSIVDSSEIEYRIIRPDGMMRWIRDRSFAVKDAAGNVIRNAGIAEDITARKNAEDASGHLAAIVHSCEHAIYSGTLDGVITSWNNAAERLYGFTTGEAIGKNVRMLIPEEGTEQMRQNLQRVARGERVEQFVATRIRKDGSRMDVAISISPIRDAAGKIVGISKIARDITVRRRAEALELERAALNESIRAMDQVLGVVGHELRTPLTGLRAMSEYLLDDQARQTEEWDRFLKSMHDEVIRMSQTVNDLLEAARLNSGRATWNFATCELQQICEEALALVRPLIDESRVSLAKVCPLDLRMTGDADALRRLILNLVSNSRKYTDSGSIAVHVSTRQSATERWVEIRVIDTGVGIPPEIAKHLGEPFALNSGTVGANYVSGTGLGLSICKAIAAAHGGSIQFKSKAGAGTTVTVALRADLNEPVRDSKATAQLLTSAA